MISLFGRKFAAAQFGIYRAEWDLEAEPAADPMPAVTALITNQLQFHGLALSPELDEALTAASDTFEARELKRLQAQAGGIPVEQMQQLVGAALQSLQGWHAARATNDFNKLIEPFSQLIALLRPVAARRADNLSKLYGRNVTPYEALIDSYDSGRRLDFIKAEFAKLVPVCQTLLKKSKPGLPILPGHGNYSIEAQAQLAQDVITAMGYDAQPPAGRFGTSAHPLCRRVAAGEVWLTNNYADQSPLAALLTIVHEGGHARYYQSLARTFDDSWSGMVAGESLNEGMALLAEHLLARRPAFARYVAPKLSRAFGVEVGAEALNAEWLRIERDPIRSTAGEVVYPLHLILRTEIEEALINGGLEPADLPAAWNRRSTELLGITPGSDNEGCLQDIHLFAGYIGYFPCYLLGHMAAAQLWPAIERDLPELDDQIAEGDFAALNGWLTTHVYSQGRTSSPDAIIEGASGQPFAADALIAHLQARYG